MALPKEIIGEIMATKILSFLSSNSRNMTKKFVQHHKTGVVFNVSPDVYSSLNLPDIAMALQTGGEELEKFKITGLDKALSIFYQVALSLAIAQDEVNFEHRDLHVSNILIKRIEEDNIDYMWKGKPIRIKSENLMVTIIDFTLSRLTYGGFSI